LKVIYHCYGGAHASPTAAAIHLGIIAADQLPRFSDFRKIPYFDWMTNHNHGKMIQVGRDEADHEVFILARRNQPKLAVNWIKELVRLEGGDPEVYHFVDCVQLYNPFMVTGGFSSRAMGWVSFGRPLVTFGTILSFPKLVGIVHRTKKCLEMSQNR
jgi:hypothetical protein